MSASKGKGVTTAVAPDEEWPDPMPTMTTTITPGATSAVFAAPRLGVAIDASAQEREFGRLVGKCYQRLHDFAADLVSREEAPDIVHDALLTFWRRLTDPRAPYTPQNLEGFLFQQVADSARHFLRTRQRRLGLLKRVGESVTRFVATHVSSPFISGVRRWMLPSARVENEDITMAVSRGVETLPERSREVFLLNWKQGMTPREIAKSLRMNEAAVRAALSRASRAMRVHLEREGVVPLTGAPTATVAPAESGEETEEMVVARGGM